MNLGRLLRECLAFGRYRCTIIGLPCLSAWGQRAIDFPWRLRALSGALSIRQVAPGTGL